MIKNIENWIIPYVTQVVRAIFKKKDGMPIRVVFSMVDHFEPFWGTVDRNTAFQRVKSWIEKYPEIAQRHVDSTGMHPKHTFFYPQEEYEQKLLEMLANVCRKGYGEVEVHLHHDNDTSAATRQKLLEFKQVLSSRHGLLSKDRESGEIKYAFIHGNWALDNSRRDGRWCGVNDELTILQETGCYADFTLPSAPSDSQTKKINSIYYAIDDPDKPKSHDCGIDPVAGRVGRNGLLMIQGPLCLNWSNRKFGVLPRIENGSLSYDNPVTAERLKLWVDWAPRIADGMKWVFVKIHTHGCQEKNSEYLLTEGLNQLYSLLESFFNDGKRYILHYVSAREMFNLVNALQAGAVDGSENWRNYLLCRNFSSAVSDRSR